MRDETGQDTSKRLDEVWRAESKLNREQARGRS